MKSAPLHDHETDKMARGLTSLRAQFDLLGLYPALARLLVKGRPVTVNQLAQTGHWSVERVEAELARLKAERDDRGQIVGLGLTLRPTRHKFTFDGKTVYAWCASDALTFPVILGTAGVIESKCPVTHRTIRIEVTPDAVHRVDPSETVVSEIRPEHRVTDLRGEICSQGLFFSSREAAAEWLARTPNGQVESVVDDFAVHRQISEEVGWTTTTDEDAP